MRSPDKIWIERAWAETFARPDGDPAKVAYIPEAIAQAAVAAALEAAADIILADNYDDPDSAADAILALRDKPAPGLTPKIEVKFTWAKGDEEFWVHLKSPDGKSAGFNLGNPKGMIATALLRAIAGGGDE